MIYDPKAHDERVKDVSFGRDALLPAAEKRILDTLFGGNYLTADKRCKGGMDLAAARKAGDFQPRVSTRVSGSFTAPGVRQDLFLVHNGECGAVHADGYGSITLALFEGNKVIAKALIPGGSSINGIVDVDGNGRDELVLTTGFTNQGTTVSSASLVRFDGGELVTVKDFGQVLEENCASSFGEPREATYTFVRAVRKPRGSVEFKTEKKTDPCG